MKTHRVEYAVPWRCDEEEQVRAGVSDPVEKKKISEFGEIHIMLRHSPDPLLSSGRRAREGGGGRVPRGEKFQGSGDREADRGNEVERSSESTYHFIPHVQEHFTSFHPPLYLSSVLRARALLPSRLLVALLGLHLFLLASPVSTASSPHLDQHRSFHSPLSAPVLWPQHLVPAASAATKTPPPPLPFASPSCSITQENTRIRWPFVYLRLSSFLAWCAASEYGRG